MAEHQVETSRPAAAVMPAAAAPEADHDAWGSQDWVTPAPSARRIFAQRKLEVGAADDPLEEEADRLAEHVMRMPAAPAVQRQCDACDDEPLAPEAISRKPSYALMRKCAACEEREGTFERPPVSFIQRQSWDGGGTLSEEANAHIAASRGSGTPLPSGTRTFMEERLGADFSGVTVHTASADADLSGQIGAQAFTVGKDIYFNEGKYEPSTSDGQRLLAHELVHVVQQNPDVRAKRSTPGPSGRQRAARAANVQRKYFAPDFKTHGELIHSTVLPLFVRSNADLFIEVSIPGSSKDFAEPGKTGIADLYKANPPRTVGLRFDGEPQFLTQSTRLQYGGGHYVHNSESAPQGGKHRPRARRMAFAPFTVELGDLKPGGGAEAILGFGQLNKYTRGLEQTRDDLNTFLAADPGQSDAQAAWTLSITKIPSLTIPPRLVYPTGTGIAMNRLAVWESGFKVDPDSGLVGAMYVYKDPQPGIWSYEWIPDDIPSSTGSRAVNEVLTRLNTEVIPPLISPGATGANRKPLAPSVSKARRNVVQKKDEKFDDASWKQAHYTPWKEKAQQVLADKGEMRKASVAEALVDLKSRVPKVPVPVDVQESGKAVDKIKHWTRYGGIIGWLREKFDFIFVKVHGFAKAVKERVKKLVKTVASSSLGGWIGKAAKVIFKIFKLVGAWVVGQVLDNLVGSLRNGIMSNVKKVIDMITPEGVKAKVQEFEDLKEKYQTIIEEQEDALIARFFGDKLELFEALRKYEEVADTFSTIATIVEWGVRLLACASPPAIGCLWNLAMSALEWAFGKLMETCWFTKKVYEPIISEIDIVRRFPAEIAARIANTANEYIPVPAGFDPIFAPINVDMRNFSVDCNEGGDGADRLTPERQAILDLIDEMGPDKFNAMLELSLKRGAGPWVLMTSDRLTAMKDVLANVSADDIRAAAENKSKGVPQGLDAFLKSIQGYSATEKKLIEQSEERKRAAKAKELAEAGKGGPGGGGKGPGTSGGGKPAAPTYEIIKGPTGLDESKATHVNVGIEELTLAIRQADAHTGVSCDAKLVLNDEGNLVTIPLLRVHIDGKTQILTTGEPSPPVYYLSFPEQVSIKYSTGQVKQLSSLQLNERFIKFSAI